MYHTRRLLVRRWSVYLCRTEQRFSKRHFTSYWWDCLRITGNPHVPPSTIVAKIMDCIVQDEAIREEALMKARHSIADMRSQSNVYAAILASRLRNLWPMPSFLKLVPSPYKEYSKKGACKPRKKFVRKLIHLHFCDIFMLNLNLLLLYGEKKYVIFSYSYAQFILCWSQALYLTFL